MSKHAKVRRASAASRVESDSTPGERRTSRGDMYMQPNRPGRRHSSMIASKQQDNKKAEVKAQDEENKSFDFEGSTLMSQIEFIKKSL